jgi:hypothetical protein
MNQEPKIPSPEKIAQTIKKARLACQEMELAGLELDEAMPKAQLRCPHS